MMTKIQHIIVVTDEGVKIYPGSAVSVMAMTVVRDVSEVTRDKVRTYGHSDATWLLEEMLTRGLA